MDLEDKLTCMTANRNALKEEIEGLHLYINQLHKKLELPPKFSNAQPQYSPDLEPFICPDCHREIEHGDGHDFKRCHQSG